MLLVKQMSRLAVGACALDATRAPLELQAMAESRWSGSRSVVACSTGRAQPATDMTRCKRRRAGLAEMAFNQASAVERTLTRLLAAPTLKTRGKPSPSTSACRTTRTSPAVGGTVPAAAPETFMAYDSLRACALGPETPGSSAARRDALAVAAVIRGRRLLRMSSRGTAIVRSRKAGWLVRVVKATSVPRSSVPTIDTSSTRNWTLIVRLMSAPFVGR
jgi:hypothetical protein